MHKMGKRYIEASNVDTVVEHYHLRFSDHPIQIYSLKEVCFKQVEISSNLMNSEGDG